MAIGVIDKHGADRGPVCHRSVDRRPVDEVGQPFDSERLSLLAHDERDGVHEVGLAGSIGSDHGQERRQWTQFPETLVTLEVLQLDVAQLETKKTGLAKRFCWLFNVAY